MTAQVVILNKLAVAAASDSSVTLTAPDGRQRPFPTAEKIYPLPDPHAAAVLHSGNTQLLGVPFVVLVGEWMRTLPNARLPRLEDYGKLLMSWIGAQKALFSEEIQDAHLRWMLCYYFSGVRDDFLERRKPVGGAGELDRLGAQTVLGEVLATRLDRLRSQAPIPGWEDVDGAALLAARAGAVEEASQAVFSDVETTPDDDAMLAEIAAELVRVREPWSSDAQLVLVGFGEDELFPAQLPITFQGVLDGRLRAVADDYVTVSEDGPLIAPFAQTEAVDTFLQAYHDTYREVAHGCLDDALRASSDTQTAAAGAEGNSEVDADLEERVEVAHRNLEENWARVCRDEFVGPMMRTVGGLPPAEIARMAEALVGLQMLRQLTQAETETVGGPIDVALITRANGFRWLRHKTLGSANTIA